MSTETIIWEHETRFAREVALATVVAQGQPLWQTAIPGMFMVGLLTRLRTIRQVSARYGTVRQLALRRTGHPIAKTPEHTLQAQIRRGLADQNALVRDPDELSRVLEDMIDALAAHYQQLMQSAESTWADMLVTAYGDLATYTARTEHVAGLESELAEVVSCAHPKKQKLPIWTPLEQQELRQRTLKFARQAFGLDD